MRRRSPRWRPGARAFTHLYNAMSPIGAREPGMLGAALSHADSFVGVIADGHHVHEANLRLAFAAKRRDRVHAHQRRDAARRRRAR